MSHNPVIQARATEEAISLTDQVLGTPHTDHSALPQSRCRERGRRSTESQGETCKASSCSSPSHHYEPAFTARASRQGRSGTNCAASSRRGARYQGNEDGSQIGRNGRGASVCRSRTDEACWAVQAASIADQAVCRSWSRVQDPSTPRRGQTTAPAHRG